MEAVFEHGVLRPLQPLSLEEKQRVLLTITEFSGVEEGSTRATEQEWLKVHAPEYRGEWVALHGNELISHGPRARAVRDESRRKGVDRPLLVRIPEDPDRPSAGCL